MGEEYIRCERERKARDDVESCSREDTRERGLKREDVQEHEKKSGEKLLCELATGQPMHKAGKH